MLNEELKARVGKMVDESMMTPANKQRDREKLEIETQEFLRRKGRIIELRPDPTIAESLLF
jgi:hypothetical protein